MKELSTIEEKTVQQMVKWDLLPKSNFAGPFIPFPISNLDELVEWQLENSEDIEIIE
jgi:hypothetical protein